jgi:exodeoxyribonuclease VII small subunit
MSKKMSFEEAMAKLEDTVRRLEVGGLPLDEAVTLFEEGTRLARLCNERLDAADLKISQLTRAADGELVEGDLAVGDEGAAAQEVET